MSTTLIVGLDGEGSGDRAIAFATNMAKLIEGAEILVVYVIEWSPFSFQTAEENAERHKPVSYTHLTLPTTPYV